MDKLPDQNCKGCPHSGKCSEVYKKLGESGCKPVTTSVSVAFLLPMVIFIITVVMFNEYLGEYFSSPKNSSLISLFVGVLTAGLSVYIARLVQGRKSNKEFVEKDNK